MDNQQVKEALGKPQMMRLKTIGKGVFVQKVMGERLLIKTVDPWTQMDEAKTVSLISIPKWVEDANKPLPTYGAIVQVGDECVYSWKEGDLVLFGKFSGTDFSMNSDDYRIMHEKEVLAVLGVDLETFGAVPIKGES